MKQSCMSDTATVCLRWKLKAIPLSRCDSLSVRRCFSHGIAEPNLWGPISHRLGLFPRLDTCLLE